MKTAIAVRDTRPIVQAAKEMTWGKYPPGTPVQAIRPDGTTVAKLIWLGPVVRGARKPGGFRMATELEDYLFAAPAGAGDSAEGGVR